MFAAGMIGAGPLGARPAPDRAAQDEAPQLVNGRLVLPAWETRWERRIRRQKEDQRQWIDGHRASHPELYGVTRAPLQPVRHYAEYDPVDAVYYAWEPGTFDDFFGRLTHELMTRTAVEIHLLHHGAAERSELESRIIARGNDPADATFVDVSSLGDYYQWQTEWPWDRSLESFWAVDFGPYFVRDGAGTLGIMDPRYYWWRVNDDAVPTKLAQHLGVTVWRPDLDWEGGNLFSDGEGTCFTTVMHEAENLPQTRAAVEQQLFEYFGCDKVLWLHALHGEGTGHIDMFFKNASDTLLLVGEYDAAADPLNAEILDQNAALLAAETTAAGTPFEVRRFPMPAHDDDVWRSYANGIVVNDLVLVPTYAQDRQHEAEALAIFEQAFPGRTVVGLDADEPIAWGGAIHCVTRTRPAAPRAPTAPAPTAACGGDHRCSRGCGDITAAGRCLDGLAVYCDGDEVTVAACYFDERCGWDPEHREFYCVPAGCGELPAEGECLQTWEGDLAAVWCEGGYPLGERCATASGCAYDPTLGRVACGGGCLDECAPDAAGCDDQGDAWYCGEAGDRDDCLEPVTQRCEAGTTCDAGACVCADECAADESGCDANGDAWRCGEAGDGDDCLEILRTRCDADQRCDQARCVDAGCGCQVGDATGPGALRNAAGLLCGLLLGWLLLAPARRRRRRR
jgi:agmatine deiminase